MKICVKSGDHNFTIGFPTGLIFNKPAVWLYMKFFRKYSTVAKQYIPENAKDSADHFLANLPPEAVYAICDELRRIKRKHDAWELVDVESSSGERVKITL